MTDLFPEKRESYDEFVKSIHREDSKQRARNKVKRFIWVTFQKEGIHHYPDAPKEVSFLKHPHRHMFHFKVKIQVFDNDRDIEFIIFKRWLEDLYKEDIVQLNNKSCEMISDDLAKAIKDKYPQRELIINVREDKENGCEIQYPEDYYD